MPSERLQRRVDQLLTLIEPEADGWNWQIGLAMVGAVPDFDPKIRDAAACKTVAEHRISSVDNGACKPPSGVLPQTIANATTAPKRNALSANCYSSKLGLRPLMEWVPSRRAIPES